VKAAQDFNYKIALASGLRSLENRRLRQAEEQFRYLVQKFPQSDGGYRGLAKVQLEFGDRTAALALLLQGAAALAKAGLRGGGIELLREAVTLEPKDLVAHRRLAAALALAGEVDAAAAEYARFAWALGAGGERERAAAEARYAIERLGELPSLVELLVSLVGPAPTVEPPGTPLDALTVEERAAHSLAAGDPHAGILAMLAARRLLEEGRTAAASDLLLQLIASGIAAHEAQRLLVEVARGLGRRDVARAKCSLLAHVLRLDGRAEQAIEVERLAQAV
jgi:hypothetical protein